MPRKAWWYHTKPEALGRYLSSALRIPWSIITLPAMLTHYNFVFSQVLKTRRGGLEQAGPLDISSNLFASLIELKSPRECITRTTWLSSHIRNYAKKDKGFLDFFSIMQTYGTSCNALIKPRRRPVLKLAAFHQRLLRSALHKG
jgi:ABC-type polysaccharide/polyol phosphate export permease